MIFGVESRRFGLQNWADSAVTGYEFLLPFLLDFWGRKPSFRAPILGRFSGHWVWIFTALFAWFLGSKAVVSGANIGPIQRSLGMNFYCLFCLIFGVESRRFGRQYWADSAVTGYEFLLLFLPDFWGRKPSFRAPESGRFSGHWVWKARNKPIWIDRN